MNSDSSRAPTRQLLIYCVFSAACALFVVLRPLQFLSDDCLFYIVIADHIAKGDGSTFNGLFPTNGYHPLWEAVAAVLALLASNKPSLLVTGVLFQWALSVATIWLLFKALVADYRAQALTVFLAVMFFFFVPFGNLYWTEAPLNMFFVAAILSMLMADKPISYPILGLLLGLVFLSRLDSVFFVGSVIVGLWARDKDRRIALTIVISAIVGGAYLALNLAQFGHLMPISGATKSGFSHHIFFRGRLGTNGFIALSGAAGLIAYAMFRRSRSRHWRFAMFMLASGTLLQCLYVVAVSSGDTTWVWYYVQGYLCIALVAAETVQIMLARSSLPFGNVALALALAGSVVIVGVKYFTSWSWHDRRWDSDPWRYSWLADVTHAVGNSKAVVVVFDQPGLFAYSTDERILALDGLTWNYKLNAETAAQGMLPILTRFGSAYFMAPLMKPGERLDTAMMTQLGVPGGQIIHFRTPLTGDDAGCMYLDNRGLLVSRPVPPVFTGGVWGLWIFNETIAHTTPCP